MDKCELEIQWKAYIERCFIDILNNPNNWCVLSNPLNEEKKIYIRNAGDWQDDIYLQVVVDVKNNDWQMAIIEKHSDKKIINLHLKSFAGEKIIIHNNLYGT